MDYRFLRFPGGRAKAVTFSYDDGTRDDIRLSRIITPKGIKCTFNINSGLLGSSSDDRHLTADEIRSHILDAGHEIAVHGQVHMALGLARPVDGIYDVLSCRRELERDFGRIVRGLAYADNGITNLQNGAAYENIRRYLQDLGICYARTLGGDNNRFCLPADWYAWMPTAHHDNPQVMDYIREFLAQEPDGEHTYPATRFPRLFYLWGHSVEFQRRNNWELLEEICGALGGHEEIWYATNMEVFEYVQAWDRLVFSADGTQVYNPNLMDVWFRTDSRQYCVHPGQTLVLE